MPNGRHDIVRLGRNTRSDALTNQDEAKAKYESHQNYSQFRLGDAVFMLERVQGHLDQLLASSQLSSDDNGAAAASAMQALCTEAQQRSLMAGGWSRDISQIISKEWLEQPARNTRKMKANPSGKRPESDGSNSIFDVLADLGLGEGAAGEEEEDEEEAAEAEWDDRDESKELREDLMKLYAHNRSHHATSTVQLDHEDERDPHALAQLLATQVYDKKMFNTHTHTHTHTQTHNATQHNTTHINNPFILLGPRLTPPPLVVAFEGPVEPHPR